MSFLAQVPTGLFADRWGRRRSLAVGLFIQAVSTATTLLLAPHSVGLGSLSVSFGALAGAFIGGADRALLFGMVSRDGDSSGYGRVYGTVLAVRLTAEALATGLGGWLVAEWGWSMPYAVAVGAALWGLAVTRALPESRGMQHDAPSLMPLAHDFRNAMGTLRTIPGLGFAIALGSGLATLVTINNLYAQSTLVLKGATLEMASVLVATAGIVTAVGSWLGGRLQFRRTSGILSLGTFALGTAVATVGCLSLPGAVMGYVGAAGMDGLLDPVYESALNRVVPEAQRATLLSLPSAGFSLGMMALFPLAGWAMGAHHLKLVYGLLGLGLAVLAGGFARSRQGRASVLDSVSNAGSDSSRC